MLERPWAKKHGVMIVSGFNHWVGVNNENGLKEIVSEIYEGPNGVRGYCALWGGNWLMSKTDFYEMGGFENNLKKKMLSEYHKDNYELIMKYRFTENGWHWGTTVETYVQAMALPESSMLGNYRCDENNIPITNEHYKNGIAIGVAWKDE